MTEEKIRVIGGLDAIRYRPGMWIGGTDSRAMLGLLLHMIKEPAEMAAAGKCHEIQVHLLENNTVTIQNDGPGWLMLGQQDWKAVDLEYLFATILTPGPTSAIVSANALSTDFKAEVRRDGEVVEQSYQQGIATGPTRRLRDLEAGESTGVTITFTFDPTIFVEGARISYPDLCARLREFAFLVPGLHITLNDERQPNPSTAEFHYENGLADFVRHLNRDCVPFHEVICQSHEISFRQMGFEYASYTINVDFAIQFTDCARPFQLSFAECCETRDGGTHLDELRRGIRNGILEAARGQSLTVERRNSTFFKGMTAVIHVRHPHPIYADCTWQRLINPDMSVVYSLVHSAVANALHSALHPLQDFLDRTSTRKVDAKQRRYGEWAERMQHTHLSCW